MGDPIDRENTKSQFTDRAEEEENARLVERFRAFVEMSPGIAVYLDPHGAATVVSGSWMEFTGRTAEQTRGFGYLEDIHPDDRETMVRIWREARRERKPYTIEQRIRRRDGVYRYVLTRAKPLEKEGPGPCAYIGICTDITELKETERELREAYRRNERDRAQLAAVLQAMSDTVFVLDMEGRLVFVNDAEARLLGFSSSAELMKDNERLTAKFSHAGGARETPFVAFQLWDLEGAPLPREDWPHMRVLRGIAESNRELIVRHAKTKTTGQFNFTTTPILDGQGNQILALVLARDVTAARAAETKICESEERFRTLADNIPQLAWTTDSKGRIRWGNRRWADYTGEGASEMDATRWKNLLHPDHLRRVFHGYWKCIRAGDAWEDTFQMRRKDGEYRWFLSQAIPIRDETGSVVRWFGTNTDVTEQRRAEEEVREADQRKTEFLGVLSHELRNPLAPIRNSIYLLNRAQAGSPQAARAMEVIERQTEHLARLVDDLLDVTRISRGKVELNRSRVDLRELVRSSCEDQRSLFIKGEISLRVEQPSQPVWVDLDRTRIAQAIGNLLQNAAKFTCATGRVEVRLTVDGDLARLSVLDTGLGIARDDLRRLFTPFAQASQTLARTQGGLGLGLAIVKGFVDLHGGRVWARSDGPGNGSEFILELPLAIARTPEEATTTSPEKKTRAGDGRRSILVIEDNVDAGDSLAEVLELSGHTVNLARNGRSGLALARQTRPDVIVCDIGLPDIDGYQIARELRADETFRSTLLVALTGYAQPEDRKRAREAGFDEHFPKPPPLDKLDALLEVH